MSSPSWSFQSWFFAEGEDRQTRLTHCSCVDMVEEAMKTGNSVLQLNTTLQVYRVGRVIPQTPKGLKTRPAMSTLQWVRYSDKQTPFDPPSASFPSLSVRSSPPTGS